jgi:hypothetical protein
VFEVFSDIYFVIYNLYYFGQNNNLGARVGPVHRDGGSNMNNNIKNPESYFQNTKLQRKNNEYVYI